LPHQDIYQRVKTINRRRFLGLALSADAMPVLAARHSRQPRILSFHHRHTGEKTEVAYRIYARFPNR